MLRGIVHRSVPPAVGFLCVALLGCGGEHQPSPVGPAHAGLAVSMAIVSGADQVGVVGDTLPARVMFAARDSAGRPAAGALIRLFRDDIGSPNANPDTGRTDAMGSTAIRIRLDTLARTHVYTAQFASGAAPGAFVQVSFNETGVATTPASIGVTYPSSYLPAYGGAVLTPPVFTVRDRFGNPVGRLPISFRAQPNGSVTGASQMTDSLGRATPSTWTLGQTRGVDSLVAAAGTVTAAAVVNVYSGPPAKLVVTQGDRQQVGLDSVPRWISVQLSDADGYAIDGAPLTWSDEPRSSLSCPSITGGGGYARLNWGLDQPYQACTWRVGASPGTYTVHARSGNVSRDVTAIALERPSGLTVVAGPPPNTVFPAGASPPDDVVAQLRLPSGAPAAGYLVDILGYPRVYSGSTTVDSTHSDAQGMIATRWKLPADPSVDSLVLSVRAYPAIKQTLIVGVAGPLHLKSIAAGGAHTCATTLPFSAEPPIVCWGRNMSGELGDGTRTSRSRPTAARAQASGLAWSVSTGSAHSCAQFNDAYPGIGGYYPYHFLCWGANGSQQLGVGASGSTGGDLGTYALTDADGGDTHTCAIHLYSYSIEQYSTYGPDGVMCWGDNSTGALGDGTTTSRSTPAFVDSTAMGTTVGAVGSGDGFSCATAQNTVFCWGANADGQLGDGTTTTRLRPVALSGASIGTPTAIAVGAHHVCALDAKGVAYCWGRNSSGQLGDGTTTSRSTPVKVATGVSFASITAGGAHTCAITSAGVAYCWGANDDGQVGINAPQSIVMTPVRVASTVTFQAISAGGHHTCAISTGRAGYCWGRNGDGELGDGTTVNRLAPTPVAAYGPTLPSATARGRR